MPEHVTTLQTPGFYFLSEEICFLCNQTCKVTSSERTSNSMKSNSAAQVYISVWKSL